MSNVNDNHNLTSEFAKSVDPELIAYSGLWEDHIVLENALNIQPEDNIISITSAGCNVLSMLLKNPNSITAIDLNPAQTALFKLKIAGIKYLEHDSYLKLLGHIPSQIAWEIYQELEPCLDGDTQDYFNQRRQYFGSGLCHCGKLETYFQNFASKINNKTIKKSDLLSLLNLETIEQQREQLTKLFTPEFEEVFLAYFDQSNQSQHGRDIEKYKHVKSENISSSLLNKFKACANELLFKDNFYTQYFLTGNYIDINHSYPYLQKENFEKLKELIHKIKIVTDEVEKHMSKCPKGTYTKANLSDIFEYMSKNDSDLLMQQIASQMNPGSRIAYWNLYVDRNSEVVNKLKRMDQLSQNLKTIDRVWFYKNFHVDEVL